MTSRAEEHPRQQRPSSLPTAHLRDGERERIMMDMGAPAQQVPRDLTNAESLRLLARVRFGRIVFARYALPTIRPVNHIVDDDAIVIHANRGTAVSPDRQVVAYEADTIDERTHRGWCVIVTGTAEVVTDPDELERYRGLLRPWLPGPRDHIVRIEPDIITGVEFVDPDDSLL